MSPRGDAAVVWADTDQETQRGSILVRVKPAGERQFGRVLRIGPGGGFPAVAAAFTSSGRLYVVWATSRLAHPDERFAVRATWVSPASRRVRRVRTLDAGMTFKGHVARTAIVTTRDGVAFAAWNAARRSGPRVEIAPLRVARADSNGSFGSSKDLPPTGR